MSANAVFLDATPKMAVECALFYASLGWRVFPCRPGTRRPVTPHGHKNATCDPQRIKAWWSANTAFEPCVVGGASSRLLIVDIDGPEGEKNLARLEREFGRLPRNTPVVQTARGRHIYLRVTKSCSTRIGSLGPKLDFKCEGGWVIAPPGLHKTGVRYRWILAPWQYDVQPAPAWLEEALGAPGSSIPRGAARALVLGFLDRTTSGDHRAKALASGKPGTRRARPPTDQSAADFRFACDRLRHGADDDELFAELMARPKAQGRSRCPPPDPERYVSQTIESARSFVDGECIGARVVTWRRDRYEAFGSMRQLARFRLGLKTDDGALVETDIVAPLAGYAAALRRWRDCFGDVAPDFILTATNADCIALLRRRFVVRLEASRIAFIREDRS